MPSDDPTGVLELERDDPAVLVAAVERVVTTALAPVVGRLRALETAAADLADARARIVALETREPVPGPPGPAGPPGTPGADGVAGMTYRGVWTPDGRYVKGDVVTRDGCMWHCNADTTTRPDDRAPAWTLAVKRGRDGSGRP